MNSDALLITAILSCSLLLSIAQNSTLQTLNCTASNPLQLTVGLLAPNATSNLRSLMGFGQSVPAINIALARISSEHLIDNINFTFVWYEGDCSESVAAGDTIKLLQKYDIDVIIGPPCTTGG